VSVSDDAVTREELRSFLVTDFGAVPRPSWGFDALYREGRLFAMFDGEELIAKWPVSTREHLRRSVPGVRAFREQDDVREADWLRVPLANLGDLEEAIGLAVEAAEFVHTPEGAPKSRHMRRQDR
jgi:hypothetical protein